MTKALRVLEKLKESKRWKRILCLAWSSELFVELLLLQLSSSTDHAAEEAGSQFLVCWSYVVFLCSTKI